MLDDGRGSLDPLNLIIEVTGEKKKEKAAKVMTARTLWVPAVNNHGAFGRWGFIEISDPWDAQSGLSRGDSPTGHRREQEPKTHEGRAPPAGPQSDFGQCRALKMPNEKISMTSVMHE